MTEITIPEIEIGPEWFVADLASVGDCDDALAYLTEAVGSIERQLDLDDGSRGNKWRAGAKTSLRWKKHALEAVGRRRAFFASEERRAAAYIQKTRPDIWAQALEDIRG